MNNDQILTLEWQAEDGTVIERAWFKEEDFPVATGWIELFETGNCHFQATRLVVKLYNLDTTTIVRPKTQPSEPEAEAEA